MCKFHVLQNALVIKTLVFCCEQKIFAVNLTKHMTADVSHTQLIKLLETFVIGLFFIFIISVVDYIKYFNASLRNNQKISFYTNTLIYFQVYIITRFSIHFHLTNYSTVMIERHIIQFSFVK